jgi:ribonuclease HI
MKVNIYLETDKQSQECMQRKYGYVIETIFKGTPITREGFGSIEGTYHKTNLQALIKALGHFHKECEVCVYTRDAFVATRILKTDDMMAAGFKDTKGKPIKNAQEWEAACKKLQECKITISSQTGKHTYSAWLQEEMKKREAGGDMGKGWSLRPEQNPAEMEYLGEIIKSGYRFTYYKDRKGGIYFESEPEGGKPEWMRRADEDRKRRNRHRH